MIDKPVILQIVAGFSVESPLGGIERFVFNLSDRITNSDFSIEICGMWIFDTSYEDEWQIKLQEAGIKTHLGAKWNPQAPYSSFWSSLRKVRKDLKGSRFSLVHSHNQFSDIIAPLIKMDTGATSILRTVHNEFEWKRRPLRRLTLTNFFYPLVYSAEIGVSKSITKRLNQRKLAKVLGKKSTYIPNGIEIQHFSEAILSKNEARAILGVPGASPIIGMVGRMTEQKGFRYVIQAIPAVIARHPETLFVFIGSGDQEDQLNQRVRDLNIQENVQFTGPMKGMEKIYPAFDILVSPSLWEGLPSVIMEAMASHVPVIATNISGTNELIQAGKTGWLVPKADPINLASVISHAIKDRSSREAIAQNAFEFVKGFSIERISKQHEELYTKLLNSKG
ncbi:MAG: glycosyltransferase family 4 protein [Candidatus Hermodarchaeia archaeon]|jgi:glycosyltransferase involved in cell wall biosynthesis